MRGFLFNYDNVCLRPKYSELSSRSLANTSTRFLGQDYALPVIPSNMQDVISWDIAQKLQENEYFYVMHRFDNANTKLPQSFYSDAPKCVSISLGVNDDSKREYQFLFDNGIIPLTVTLDVAHGHHKKVKDMIEWLRPGLKVGPKTGFIIAGNVATSDGYKFLCDLGVDAVKVGIGGGSICTTRYKTGFHLPTAYSVWECSTKGERDVPIIADGGAAHFGDIAKALVLGADMVMAGRWFAECIDSPAKIHDGKKVYRGSTSCAAKGHNNHIEGQILQLAEGCTYMERLAELKQALQSSISYAGGKDISCFNTTEWQLLQ